MNTASQMVPRNSVCLLQLKRNAVTARTLSLKAVRASHVLDGSLLAVDFKTGQLPAGPEGRQKATAAQPGDWGSAATRLSQRRQLSTQTRPVRHPTALPSRREGDRGTAAVQGSASSVFLHKSSSAPAPAPMTSIR